MNRILVVDDERAIRLLYSCEFTEAGYDVSSTGDGSEVLGLIAKARPDVVVLDIRLGGSSGLDILQEIRNRWYDLPVVLCTAYPVFSRDERSVAADYCVVKGSDLGELKRKVRMALESTVPFPAAAMGGEFSDRTAAPGDRFLAGPAGAARDPDVGVSEGGFRDGLQFQNHRA